MPDLNLDWGLPNTDAPIFYAEPIPGDSGGGLSTSFGNAPIDWGQVFSGLSPDLELPPSINPYPAYDPLNYSFVGAQTPGAGFWNSLGNALAATPSFLAGVASPAAKILQQTGVIGGRTAGQIINTAGGYLGQLPDALGRVSSGLSNFFSNGVTPPTPKQAYDAGAALDSSLAKWLPAILSSPSMPPFVQTIPSNPNVNAPTPSTLATGPMLAGSSPVMMFILVGLAVTAALVVFKRKK